MKASKVILHPGNNADSFADVQTVLQALHYGGTVYAGGTVASGTYTPSPANGYFQEYTNGGAHTLAPPTVAGSYRITLDITNNASAGAITTSSFTKVDGDSLDTTNAHAFRLYIVKGGLGTHMTVKRMV